MNQTIRKYLLIVAVATFGISLNSITHAADNSSPEQTIKEMEIHWDKLMTEKNTDKRKKLIAEHRNMMDKAMKQSGMSGMGMMHNSNDNSMKNHHHSHMVNTIQMHYMQLDMMD